MSHKSICLRIRCSVIGAAFCLLLVIVMICGSFLKYLKVIDFPDPFYIWHLFAALGIIPCFAALVFAWKISNEVSRDRSFSHATAALLGKISSCALFESGFVFIVTAVILISLQEIVQTRIILLCLVAAVVSLAASMAFAALARFVQKAADLQEESDLTV